MTTAFTSIWKNFLHLACYTLMCFNFKAVIVCQRKQIGREMRSNQIQRDKVYFINNINQRKYPYTVLCKIEFSAFHTVKDAFVVGLY